MEAVAADILSSGVLDQLMAEELSNTPDFTDQDTKPVVVNTFDPNLLNSFQHQGNFIISNFMDCKKLYKCP